MTSSQKLKILQDWDKREKILSQTHPLKTLSSLPQMPGMTKETAKGLTWKSIRYLLGNDPQRIFPRHFFKHPFKYAYHFVRSVIKPRAYTRDGDFFLYGLKDLDQFQRLLQTDNGPLALGFSYCHKPFECPSGRFSDQCAHLPDHPVCGQCFIGKTLYLLPSSERKIYPLFIPTIHYIGQEMFKLREKHPNETLLFIITACEMTLEMFGHWGNMIQAKGIGVRLDGRICNTMKAFELSERGIKPGLTVVLPHTQQKLLDLLQRL